jgi:hypothetical protein
MKYNNRKKLSSALVALSFAFVAVSSQAATVILDPNDPTIAFGVKGLEVDGTTYDVAFPQISGGDFYGPFPPGSFTFDSEDKAIRASSAVIAALNGSTATVINDPSSSLTAHSSKWKIGYSLNDRGGEDKIDAIEARFEIPRNETVGFWALEDNKQIELHVAINWADFNQVSDVPIPAAAWLFGSSIIGLLGLARRKTV